jgi:hypothetical protein
MAAITTATRWIGWIGRIGKYQDFRRFAKIRLGGKGCRPPVSYSGAKYKYKFKNSFFVVLPPTLKYYLYTKYQFSQNDGTAGICLSSLSG